jgi:hypothetical protein
MRTCQVEGFAPHLLALDVVIGVENHDQLLLGLLCLLVVV